ncbi:MAG TPA: NAD(P)H-hydrate epimerase [Planctomycetota bacterium]|nr:NAD(P)H-hydrate epimerase [Planctomycetota bacterium]
MGGFPDRRRALGREELRDFDNRASAELGIPPAILMENAGGNAAREALALLAERGRDPAAARAAILCGGGNNGGDGYVVARHLRIAGAAVEVFSAVPRERLSGEPALFRSIVERMGIPVETIDPGEGDPGAGLAAQAARWGRADLLVDALLGTGFRGELRADLARILGAANALRGPLRVALDLPSGLDCDSGHTAQETFRADLTVTFVARKLGFDAPAAQPYLGRVVVAGIGAPWP